MAIKMPSKPAFKNIPEAMFQCNHEFDVHVSGVVLATQRTSGMFTLNKFSMMQFFKGGLDPFGGNAETQVVLSKLGVHAIEDDDSELFLDRSDVLALRILLEARMAHCEKQRDERHSSFNPDTYIAQKFLLLDIREWLMIDAIGEFEEQKPVIEPLKEDIKAMIDEIVSNRRYDVE